MGYITTTHILDRLKGETLVVNDPFWVAIRPRKLLVLDFPDLTPPTTIARDHRRLREFKAGTATSSSSRFTATAGRACSGSTPTTATSPRCTSFSPG
jgi:hypothetical protein